MPELELYKIPQVDPSLPSNPGDLSAGGAAIDNSTSNPTSGGLNEQQVRDIVNSMRSTYGMTEDKVRAIVNSMQKFLTGQNIMMDGIQKSQNFVSGSSGWQIDAEGNAEFNNGTFRGTFNIGGTNITIDNTEDIQENLDTINTAGGGTLFLQPGTYTLTADISIPSGVTLQGVNRDGVILDCDSAYSVTVKGTNVYSTGTLAISDTQTEVVGTGTTFTSAMVGRYIFLSGAWYEITGFTDTTHIDISPAYSGDNLSGYAVAISDVNFNATLNKVTITNSDAGGIECSHASEPNFKDLIIYDNVTGLDLDYVVFPKIEVGSESNGVNLNMNFVEGFKIDYCVFGGSTTSHGVIMTDSGNSTFFDSSVTGNTGDGINLTNCKNIAILSFDVSSNGGQGIELVSGCNDNQIISGRIVGNTSDGVKLTATSDRNTIVGVSIKDSGGYGINIAASTCDNNQIISPSFSNNTSGNVNDGGINTFVSPAITTTVIPTPIVPQDTNAQQVRLNVNTTAYVGQINIPFGITVNKVSIRSAGTVTTSGTLDISLYSQSGQIQYFSVTTGTISATNTIYTTAVSSVFLNPGIYYIMVNPNDTASIDTFFFGHTTAPFSTTAGLPYDVSSEPILEGTITITAGTPPATFNPASDVTEVAAGALIVRLDN